MKAENINEVWSAMKLYHSLGLSMIWARTETEVVRGIERPPKTPIGNWKQAQSQRYSLDHLARLMTSTTVAFAPAIVCGEVSGNLEVIDIDVKHWPGIDTMYFVALKDFYPDLFARLRIHKTQSGGFHLLYRSIEPLKQGNQKLAAMLDGKGKPKEAGIETRGQGGYIVCPPGRGYTVFRDVPIPVITKEERDALLTLARLYDQRIKIAQVPHTKSHESVYDENPFDHFNNSPDAETILQDCGWTVMKQNAQFIQFNRPGKERGGGSASFIKKYRLYHIFTTSTEFEGDKNYRPVEVLAILKFNGNWKEVYRYLVSKGFGKVKRDYENQRVKKYASMKSPLPPNYSKEAKEAYERELNENARKYPHGMFWGPAKDFDGYKISRLALVEVTTKLGFCLFQRAIIRLEKPYFTRIEEERTVYDILKQDIQEEDLRTYEDVLNAFDAFWQYNGKHVLSRLPIIDESALLRSTRSACYAVFQNTILRITGSEIAEVDPATMDKLIDTATIIPRIWNGLVDWQGLQICRLFAKSDKHGYY